MKLFFQYTLILGITSLLLSLSPHIQMLREYLKNKPDIGTVKIQF